MILQDHHAGHRDYYTGEVDGPADPTEWDYALSSAFQIIEDNQTPEGHLRWESESDRVTFDAKRRINKARAAIERRTKGTEKVPYKPQDGEYWVTEPVLMDRGANPDWPTMSEWVEDEVRKNTQTQSGGE